MKYSDSYLFNHDIDWFCVINGVFIHVASAGGSLPNLINDDKQLRNIQHQVALLPDIYSEEEIEYNETAIAKVINTNVAESRIYYVESFAAMARKGFVSFDKTFIEDEKDNRYHLVCKPKTIMYPKNEYKS